MIKFNIAQQTTALTKHFQRNGVKFGECQIIGNVVFFYAYNAPIYYTMFTIIGLISQDIELTDN